MKKTFLVIATAAALLAASSVSAQVVPSPNPCPRYGTPQQGRGPRDGTGYGAKSGAKSGKRSGPQDGSGQKQAQKNRRGR
jgi:opacity protein-like surface antigen